MPGDRLSAFLPKSESASYILASLVLGPKSSSLPNPKDAIFFPVKGLVPIPDIPTSFSFASLAVQSHARVSSSPSFPSKRIDGLYSASSISESFQSRGYIEGTRELPEDKDLHSRSWRNYVIPTAVLVMAGAGLFIHYNDEKRAIPKGSHQTVESDRSKVNRPAIGGPFKLFDIENHLVTESNLQGNWILMHFGYTSSPDVGPEEVRKMAEVIKILESENDFKIIPVFVSIDPQRDSPTQLKAYLEEFDSRIVGLTGPIAAVRQMAQEYRVYFKKVDEEGQDYLVECSHNMYLLDPNMEMLRYFGVEYDALQLSNAIMMEVKKTSR